MTVSALDGLPVELRGVVEPLSAELARVPGLAALVLGGSWARGTARPDSDLDLGLYYRDAAPLDLDALRKLAASFHDDGPLVLTAIGDWGEWVNGGAWLATAAGKVDLLYRSADRVSRAIAEAQAGEARWDYAHAGVYGFHSVIYLAEVATCRPLFDPEGLVAGFKASVAGYPPALRAALVQSSIWGADFTLKLLPPYAARGDVYNTVGSLTRALGYLTQALFALNEKYFTSDKDALAEIAGFAQAPAAYGERVAGLLAAPGGSPDELRRSVAGLESLVREVAELAGPLYAARYG